MTASTNPDATPPSVVHRDAVIRTVYATDNSIYQVKPEAVALPDSAEQVAAIIAETAQAAQPTPIVARGGGTGTNGQSLTDSLVLDLKRNLNRVLEFDPVAQTATVEPGLVTSKLNAAVAPHGLFWPPHTSTLNRATVGGMIATDAAGKGSMRHGRAHRHVAALHVVLDDGTRWRAAPTPRAEAEERAKANDRIGRLWQDLLRLPLEPNHRLGLPELARGFSGYGLDRLFVDDMVDPVAVLCGSEGTLAVTTAAELVLHPLPSATQLLVVGYGSFGGALEDAVVLRDSGPEAIETFDETTLARGRSSSSWWAIEEAVDDDVSAVLLLEFADAEEGQLQEAQSILASTGRARSTVLVTEPARQRAAWSVRADAVGLLARLSTGGPGITARPTAFVEDCAVPVDRMSSFIADFRTILDRHGLTYGMFGHADVGCVHVRPALDLTDPSHEALVRTVTDEVTALVRSHEGILWGEHGRGFRGEAAAQLLPADTIALMEQVKAAFDPKNRFNPGKLYRPFGSAAPVAALDEPPMRGQFDRRVPLSLRSELRSAFACNGNSLCQRADERGAMCPSFRATGDPALSPKGRADLLRSWAAEPDDLDFADQVASNLHQCLSCAACAGECPVEVDIPELKSRFLEQHHRRRSRPPYHHALARFEQVAMITAHVMATTGVGLPDRMARWLLDPLARTIGLVELPVPQKPRRRSAAFRRRSSISAVLAEAPDVVLLPDVFTSALDPELGLRAIDLLETLGLRVGVAPFVPSGKFSHVKGMRQHFARTVARHERLVNEILDAGAVPVVVEPAVAMLYRREYPAVRPGFPTGVMNIAEVLDQYRGALPPLDQPVANAARPIRLLPHCMETALAPELVECWVRVLSAAGGAVEVVDVGCCGMAGIFGHEEGNQELTRAIWTDGWGKATEGRGELVGTGFSCRSQASRFGSTDRPVIHPLGLWANSAL